MASTSALSQPLDPSTTNLLVTEILGFTPVLLLDDLTNISHFNVQRTVEAFEAVLRQWIDRQDPSKHDAYNKELEGGITLLQTLLDSHSDIAFDLFETWAWRNIFNIPANVPIVTPHHQGLDLTITEQEEREVQEELEKMKQKLDATKRLGETLQDAVKNTSKRKERSETQLRDLEFLANASQLRTVPSVVGELHEIIQQLPHELPRLNTPDPEKRQWEGSHFGFLAWSVAKAVEATRAPDEVGTGILINNGEGAAQYMKTLDDKI